MKSAAIRDEAKPSHGCRKSRPMRGPWFAAALIMSTSTLLVADRPRIVFSRLAPTHVGLFLADADGKNERPLLPATSLITTLRFPPMANG